MYINAFEYKYTELNQIIKDTSKDIIVDNCLGQRFIASGEAGRTITINGTPGNALGAYLNGARIIVNGNVQDAVGDTMNAGKIIVHGNAGDALGYAMRGGEILISGDSGYRTGIHMKQYEDKCPVIIVGGSSGSFLGEYLAGGVIIVLGLNTNNTPVGNYTATGMHGGEIWIRSSKPLSNIPEYINVEELNNTELVGISKYLEEYSKAFDISMDKILDTTFYKLTPNAKNIYKQLYTKN